MKINNVRKIAQGTTTSKFDKKINNAQGDIMKKPQLSIDCYRKLHRSSTVSGAIFTDLKTRDVTGPHRLYVPFLFSYIHDDISDIESELKELGLFSQWESQKAKEAGDE